MNTIITSKNFKATFKVIDMVVFNLDITGTGGEARKFLKNLTPGLPPEYVDDVIKVLEGNETALRTYVLAKIGA